MTLRVLSIASEAVPLIKTGAWPMWWVPCPMPWRRMAWQ
jgi:hypothetical protein